MSTLLSSNRYLNPDEDFVLHGKAASSWKHSGYLTNSLLTNTTSNLNQHAQYNHDNFQEKKKDKKYVRALSDLSKSVQYNGNVIDHDNQLVVAESRWNSNPKYGGKEFSEKGFVNFATPREMSLGKLRLQKLRLEEAKLLELKRLEKLENIRKPKAKWYESTGPEFHYEARKNTQMIRSISRYQDMLDYREDLLRSSSNSLRKYSANKQFTLAC